MTNMNCGTFSHQNSLPNLPLPKLGKTIEKYLKSLIPILSHDEHIHITQIAQDFVNSEDAKQIQRFLLKKLENEKNWLEEWWYDAYTTNRDTLLTQNMGGIIPKTFGQSSSQLEVAAKIIHHIMNYWQAVRREQIEVTKSRGTTWDMFQVYNLFNASRVPDYPKDRIERYFCTEAEGNSPSHVLILCNGHIYKLETVEKGTVRSIPELMRSLADIRNSSTTVDVDSIVKLTSFDRDSWAEIRSSIIDNSSTNEKLLNIIDSAVFSLTLSDDIVDTDSQLMKYSIFGSPNNCYCDKNLNIIVLRDGKSCLQAEHGNVDAISLFAPCDHAAAHLYENLDKTASQVLENSEISRSQNTPQKLNFEISCSLSQRIQKAKEEFWKMGSKINVNVYHYENFGATFCKTRKLYADTIIQIALQMAFFKTHNKLAPTYETASTRKFYHGRTETVRSLTPEIEKYLRAFEDAATNETIRTLFFDAYNAHNTLMDAARDGKGIDRHFLGMRHAEQALRKLGNSVGNPLLDHVSYSKSGGNGNFLLSTSFLGYEENGCFGYVTPMCKDGYGTFYRINSTRLTFTITNFNDDSTNFEEFRENLEYSLDFIKNVVLTID